MCMYTPDDFIAEASGYDSFDKWLLLDKPDNANLYKSI